MNTNLNVQKKSEVMQFRTTEHLKEQLRKLAAKDGLSQNAVLNQALAWYAEERSSRNEAVEI
ncbi:hypothetical protein J8V57_01210 [Xenorhabdus sp. PB61.4]|uniref:hypothetical protein n=1 Tax=Xenorhabdus sp. PB61.4 TaxID=2788940 RepID=UPI001E508871|nr:hypothetical protein [Xenorhabdus sp. PB61.4]MCC8364908.1 hypothetical protein [Xenorhabdus sp. PB61.4]